MSIKVMIIAIFTDFWKINIEFKFETREDVAVVSRAEGEV